MPLSFKNINSLSEGTKEIHSKCRWLAIFTEYLFCSLVSNESVYILPIPLKNCLIDEDHVTQHVTFMVRIMAST